MKKHTTQVVTQPQPKQARTLFGLSSDELKAVYGGGGVIINSPTKPPSVG
jgi:hypothetical protein